MNDRYIIDVYADELGSWAEMYDFKKKVNLYGTYYTIDVTSQQRDKLLKKLKKEKIKHRWYDSRWERSSNYRVVFFSHNKPPYRCRYCHRKLSEGTTVVDHLIPVAKAKTSVHARNILALCGASDVNDYRNLVPSCWKCNRKKSDHMGTWVVRGFLGKYKLFWIVKRTVKIAAIAVIVYAVIAR